MKLLYHFYASRWAAKRKRKMCRLCGGGAMRTSQIRSGKEVVRLLCSRREYATERFFDFKNARGVDDDAEVVGNRNTR